MWRPESKDWGIFWKLLILEMWNWTQETSFKMKSRGRVVVLTHHHYSTNTHPNRKKHWLQTPTGSDVPCISNKKCLYLTTQARERKIFSLPNNKPSQWELLQLSQWEIITTLNSHFPPVDIHSKYFLPTSSFSIKWMFFPLFAGLVYS